MIEREEADFAMRQQLVNSGQTDPGRTLLNLLTVRAFSNEWLAIVGLVFDTAQAFIACRVHPFEAVSSSFREGGNVP